MKDSLTQEFDHMTEFKLGENYSRKESNKWHTFKIIRWNT